MPTIFSYDFDWSVLWRYPYGGWLLKGILTTIHLALLSWIVAVVIGTVVGTMRVSPSKVARFLGAAYVEIIRNIPILLQLFFWYFAMPKILPNEVKWWWNHLPNNAYLTAVVAISVYTGARVAEHIRSGFHSVPLGQYSAGLSTGLSLSKTYWHVIIPYAVRIMIPSLTSEFLSVFKSTALAMTIAVFETTLATQTIESFTFHGLEATTAASLVYVGTSMSVVVFMAWVERRLKIPGMIKRGKR